MGLVMLPYLELEEKYAKFVGTQYACATNTGTAALHLAIEALEMPNDTQVIVPDFTMYASGLAVHYARLTPVFIDCTEDLLIDLDKVEKHFDMTVNKWRSRILMITHVYGRTVDMDRVDYIAKKKGVDFWDVVTEHNNEYEAYSMFVMLKKWDTIDFSKYDKSVEKLSIDKNYLEKFIAEIKQEDPDLYKGFEKMYLKDENEINQSNGESFGKIVDRLVEEG